MAADRQRLYSVLTRTEVRNKMKEKIDRISEVFMLSNSTATVVLIHLRWRTYKAMERLSEEKDQFLTELGFSDSDKNESNSSSADLESADFNGNDLVSTPFCSHRFDTTYWRDYLSESLKKKNKEERVMLISCPNTECIAPVGPDTIEKLPEDVKEMYDDYVLGSFMDSEKKSIKKCPAEGCNYAIMRRDKRYHVFGSNYAIKRRKVELEDDDDGDDDELEYDFCELEDDFGELSDDDDDDDDDEDESEDYDVELEDVDDEEGSDFGVVCLCGHIFCWTCQLEPHRPVTCKNASLWLNRLKDETESLEWISTNTKPCPDCNSPVENDCYSDLRFVTCTCRCSFCWLCLRSEEEHNGELNCVEVSVPKPEEDYNLTHHLKLWEVAHEAMEIAKTNLKDIEQKSIPKLTKGGVKDLKEAWRLVVQWRLVLKWSYVFDYFLNDYLVAKKHYLKHLRDQASTVLSNHEETLQELMKQANSGGDITLLQHKSATTTTTTVNYFHSFVKTLEDGLSEVEVDAYENEPINDWFCDRCTSQNSWSDKTCQMCFSPLVSPPYLAFGYKN